MISLKHIIAIIFANLLIPSLFISCGILTPEETPKTAYFWVTTVDGYPVDELTEIIESEPSDSSHTPKAFMDIPLEFRFTNFKPTKKIFDGMVKFKYG